MSNMKNFVVAKNSWHRKMVARSDFVLSLPRDFCSYWRTVIFLLIAYAIFAFMVVTTIALFSLFTLVSFAFAPLTSTAMVIMFALIFGWLWFKPEKKSEDVEYNIVKMKYKSWKGKYCPMVEYKD
jgi:hypothetical protein